MKCVLLIFVAMIWTNALLAQNAPDPMKSPQSAAKTSSKNSNSDLFEKTKAIRELSFLLGEWEGGGTTREPYFPQKVYAFERVTLAAGEASILMQGYHDTEYGYVLRDGVSIISYNTNLKIYQITLYMQSGKIQTNNVELIKDHGIRWTEPFGIWDGQIRRTIKVEDGVWVQFNELSRDAGKTWKSKHDIEMSPAIIAGQHEAKVKSRKAPERFRKKHPNEEEYHTE